MDKPVTLSVKHFLIRKMAVDTMVPEKIIEAVINHQFSRALEEVKVSNSLDFSGWGRFIFSEYKAKKQLTKYLSQKEQWEKMLNGEEISTILKNSLEVKIKNVINDINLLKIKLNV
jgi:hypothetical protein